MTVGADQQESYILVCKEFDAHHIICRATEKLPYENESLKIPA